MKALDAMMKAIIGNANPVVPFLAKQKQEFYQGTC